MKHIFIDFGKLKPSKDNNINLSKVNPSEGNCIDSHGNHYIKNLPNTPKEHFKY